MTIADRLATIDVAELAVRIQQIPAPTFAEHERARFVERAFAERGLESVLVEHADDLPNVYARVPGRDRAAPALVVSAHLDTVFPATTDLTVTRDPVERTIHGPGIGDNSLAVAALLALAEVYGRAPHDTEAPAEAVVPTQVEAPPCDIWLVANAGEEGLGNLRGIRAALGRLSEEAPGGIGCGVVLEGMALGFVYHAGVGSRRYRLRVQAPGGHSWGDFGSSSAVHELVRRLRTIVDMDVPDSPRTTFNVGTVSGGTTINTIASQAHAEIDLRSENAAELDRLEARVRAALRPGRDGDVDVVLELIGDREAGSLDPEHPLVRGAIRALDEAGVPAQVRVGSTDLNALLSAGVPGVCVGVSTGGRAHRLDEYINLDPLEQGLRQLGLLVPEAARIAAAGR
ncbi:MAG: M20/M25/M40 family metallo-hydrolase [Spirochaetota bacterium]